MKNVHLFNHFQAKIDQKFILRIFKKNKNKTHKTTVTTNLFNIILRHNELYDISFEYCMLKRDRGLLQSSNRNCFFIINCYINK